MSGHLQEKSKIKNDNSICFKIAKRSSEKCNEETSKEKTKRLKPHR